VLFQHLHVSFLFAHATGGSSIRSVTLDDILVHVDARLLLKVVYVLCEVFLQDALVLQEFHEVVSWCRCEIVQVEILTKTVECLRVLVEVVYREKSLRLWDVVLGQVRVDACFRRSEIGNTSAYTDSSSRKNTDLFEFFVFETIDKLLVVKLDAFWDGGGNLKARKLVS